MKHERYKAISSADIEKYSGEVERIWKSHLQRFDVKLPEAETLRRIMLAILLAVKDRFGPEAWIHKDDISELIRRENPDAGSDQQVRHLKRDGWNLETKHPGFHRNAFTNGLWRSLAWPRREIGDKRRRPDRCTCPSLAVCR